MDDGQLIKRYGQPVRLDTAGVLRAMGLRRELHPRDAFACRYGSMEAARAFAAVNRERNGLTVHGPILTEVGPISVVDFRAALERSGSKPTDPALPDDVKPARNAP